MNISRRTLLRRTLQVGGALAGVGIAGTSYGFWEASQIRVRKETIPVPGLPSVLTGIKVCVMTDLHHGPFVGISFIREAVKIANSLKPDLFALVGDFAHRGSHVHEELPPCLEALSQLDSPLGSFAVPGNHDMQHRGRTFREVIASTPLVNLTNANRRIDLRGAHFWLAGVDDLWWGRPDLDKALRGIPEGEAILLLSHNPDFAEESPDPRVGLVLCGHMHGGQIYLPGTGRWLPSRYGEKYRGGLVQGPASKVFISRGLGEAGVPLRVNVPPEINVLTLVPEPMTRSNHQ